MSDGGDRRSTGDPFDLTGARVLIATMHAKERVIAPVLAEALGLRCAVPEGFDTDRFGTFTREVVRTGSQLEAARAKARAALDLDPQARIAVASEGSFGPHPSVPFVALNRELVLLVDRRTGLEVIGHHATMETNFAHRIVAGPDDALAFAKRIGFPAHGLVVLGCRGDRPAPDLALAKGIVTPEGLARAVRAAVALCGAAFVETDMRAHVNPTRMRAIEWAARDLVRRLAARCPCCDRPGFDVVEQLPGLPCSWCDSPTGVLRAEVLGCSGCGHRVERPATPEPAADPGQCPVCNP